MNTEIESVADFLDRLAEHLEASGMPGKAGDCTVNARRLRAALLRPQITSREITEEYDSFELLIALRPGRLARSLRATGPNSVPLRRPKEVTGK